MACCCGGPATERKVVILLPFALRFDLIYIITFVNEKLYIEFLEAF